ncbi:MAG: transporter [Candidatus Symbiobacter sp.]|nr:transporter [Candidatus Symbiobacter sp.]
MRNVNRCKIWLGLGWVSAWLLLGMMVTRPVMAASPLDYEPENVSQSEIFLSNSYQNFTRQDGVPDSNIHSNYYFLASVLGYQHMTEFFGNPMRLTISVPFEVIGARSNYFTGRENIGLGDLSLDAIWWVFSEPEIDQNLGVRLTLTPPTGDYRETLDANTSTGHMTTTIEIGYRYGFMGVLRPIITIEPVLSVSYHSSQQTYYMGPRLTIAPILQPQLFLSSRPFDSYQNLEIFGGGGAQLGGNIKYDNGTSVKGSNQIYLDLGATTDFFSDQLNLRAEAQIPVSYEKSMPYAPGAVFILKAGYKF